MTEPRDENESEQLIEDLSDLGTGIHVITITYENDPDVLPEVHLGDCSPWVAATLLKAAQESIEMLIPPINISYKGDMLLSHSTDFDEIDPEEKD
jgi:hypothetical protein